MGFKTLQLLSACIYGRRVLREIFSTILKRIEQSILQQNTLKQKSFPLGWKGYVNHHPVLMSDHFRADQMIMHVFKSIVQMPTNHWPIWGIKYLSRNPVPAFDHTVIKINRLPNVKSLPGCNLDPFPCILSLDLREKCLAAPSPCPLLRLLRGDSSPESPEKPVESNEVTAQPPVLQTRK